MNKVLSRDANTSASTWSVVSDNFGLFFHGDWDDLGREVEIFAEVLDSFVGENPVKVTPGKLLLEEASGGQGLASLKYK